jgi:sugar-phosphatase
VSQQRTQPGWQANRTLHDRLFYHRQVGSRKLLASALLFDMDGTLVDSKAVVERAWAFWAQRHNLALAEILDYSHGRPTLSTMRYFGERFSPGTDWRAEADELQALEAHETGGTVAISGALEILLQLTDAPWAVVTSAPRQLAQARLGEAGLPLPRVLVPADEISQGKPDPEGFLKAARQLAVRPGECVVFEDTPPGIEAGLRAGMQVVGMLTTVSADRLATPHLIRNFFDLRVTVIDRQFEIEIK